MALISPQQRRLPDPEIKATPLAERVTPETFALIVADTEELLGGSVDESGLVRVPIRATLLAARRG